MGEVWKAEDLKLGRQVALKFLAAHLVSDPEVHKRFEREARAAASLSHPNICTVYEIDEADGRSFLAMEMVKGEPLDARIDKGPLPLNDAIDLARQIAEGLQEAHGAGVVHRDIKPANVLITADGRAKILDFGLALLTEGSKLTKLETTVGTVAYMSPEQAQGAEVDQRTDIWALGVVLYEMIAGVRPFTGQYDQALLYEIVNQEPEPLTALRAGVPMELEFIVGKCLAKDAPKRYQQANEIVVDLRNVQDKLKSGQSTILKISANDRAGAALSAHPPPTHGFVPARKFHLLAVFAAALTIALVGFVSWHFSQSHAGAEGAVVRRFSFTPDTLDRSGTYRAAISPDGRRIVYLSGETPARLWIRDLDREEVRPLEGTEGASHRPFWSSDSTDIGFVADGRLKSIRADGGPPNVICRLSTDKFGGGTWRPDGESILFSAPQAGGTIYFYEVPSRGGVASPLEHKGLGVEVLAPTFLPEGAPNETLLYQSAGRIYLRSLRSGERQFVAEGANPLFSPTGHILYQNRGPEGGLWALPFSLDDLKVVGDAFPIAEAGSEASLSADGTLVSVDLRRIGAHQLTWRDETGRKLSSVGQQQFRIRNIGLSPDGKRVVVAGQDIEGGDWSIWLHDAERPTKHRLTFEQGDEDLPAWAPNGDEVVYRALFQERAADLFARQADGLGESRRIIESSARESEHAVSPDGNVVIYQVAAAPGVGFDLRYVQSSDEGQTDRAYLETEFNEIQPSFSPDGRYVVYSSSESGRGEIYARRFPEGDGLVQVSSEGGGQPSWGPAGHVIDWVADDTLMVARVDRDAGLTVNDVRPVFRHSTLRSNQCCNYAVAADGRILTIDEVDAAETSPQESRPAIHITENWFEEFRELKPD